MELGQKDTVVTVKGEAVGAIGLVRAVGIAAKLAGVHDLDADPEVVKGLYVAFQAPVCDSSPARASVPRRWLCLEQSPRQPYTLGRHSPWSDTECHNDSENVADENHAEEPKGWKRKPESDRVIEEVDRAAAGSTLGY